MIVKETKTQCPMDTIIITTVSFWLVIISLKNSFQSARARSCLADFFLCWSRFIKRLMTTRSLSEMCPENWHCKRARIKRRNNSRDGSNDAKWKYLKNLFFFLGFLVRLLLYFFFNTSERWEMRDERFSNGYDFWSGIKAEEWIGLWLGLKI